MTLSTKTHTLMEDIVMSLDRNIVSRIVNNALEEHLSDLISRVVSNVEDELSGLASNIEDVVSDAINSATRAGENVDHDDVESLHEKIVKDVMEALESKGLTKEPAEPPPLTIAERHRNGEISTAAALYEALDTPVLTNAQVTELLKVLSTDYEPAFALFLWRNRNGSL